VNQAYSLIISKIRNSNFEIRNNIKIQISNVQNTLFRILYFGHLNLFRILDFVLRASLEYADAYMSANS